MFCTAVPIIIDDNQKKMDMMRSPLMFSAMRGTERSVLAVLATDMPGGRDAVDRPDPDLGVTPLMALSMRDDEDVAVRIARALLSHGAGVNTDDGSVGARPITMAAQNGRPQLLKLLCERGAAIDYSPPNSTTQPIWLAAQNGHANCIAVLAAAAATTAATADAAVPNAAPSAVVDATNRAGRTPCCVAMEMGHAEAVGALIRAGADVRRATPMHYSVIKPGTETVDNFDPTPEHKVHHAIEQAVRSHARKECAACHKTGDELQAGDDGGGGSGGAGGGGGGGGGRGGGGGGGAEEAEEGSDASKKKTAKKKLSRCAKCGLAYFCDRDCQLKAWASHKLVCGKLYRGASLVAAALGGGHGTGAHRV